MRWRADYNLPLFSEQEYLQPSQRSGWQAPKTGINLLIINSTLHPCNSQLSLWG